jgi:ribosomal protein S18 acetylase RimI-like enzyme
MRYRRATPHDAVAVAALHADSWRRHYRGVWSDAYLDGDVHADRLAVWTATLTHPAPDHHTIVAEDDGVLVGFAHTVLDDDGTWGALLDNLHVAYSMKRSGIGTKLMAETAQAVIEHAPASGLFLWVLEQNAAARAFYEARGGACAGRGTAYPPGGGAVPTLRISWPDPSVLLHGKSGTARRRRRRVWP